MQGVPRFGLRTRADFELLQQLALQGQLRPTCIATLQRHWQGLLAGRWTYVYDRDLAADENPDGEAPQYLVIESEDEASGEMRRAQHRRIEAPSAAIFQLGFTVPEVEQAISALEAL